MEGNPARPEISIPLTRDNHQQYYELLMARATAYIARSRKQDCQVRITTCRSEKRAPFSHDLDRNILRTFHILAWEETQSDHAN